MQQKLTRLSIKSRYLQMFVTESNTFDTDNMKLRLTNMEGVDWIVDVPSTFSVDKLKVMALGHFYAPAQESSSMRSSLYHRLLCSRNGKVLDEDSTLAEAGVENNDEVLLLRRRIAPSSAVEAAKKTNTKEGPTKDEIMRATKDLPSPSPTKIPDEGANAVDFQRELRKILISLIEAAQKILHFSPDAAEIFKETEEFIQGHANDAPPKLDSQALKQLRDMGFPEQRAAKALLLNRMSTVDAMEWLLDHEQDTDIDEPVPGMSNYKEPRRKSADVSHQRTMSKMPGKVSNILESYRAMKRREFRPNQRAQQNLTEMGFEIKDVREALLATGNNEDAACEWLLGDRKAPPPEDSQEGLDVDGPIYKAIMSNPVVQLGLNNRRSLSAFVSMLDNPATTSHWLNDPETGPMLVQISRIYHAEKNAANSRVLSASGFS
ncbi:ubiquitin-associated domain-containing protein 1-like isoform X2 [Lineus longissimus]|uniref:ubiquitin-associated domain-containing protein 1-like isoform X2 n=1 Tax=Lineus longissimus TaxID=88925 RepID=UPI00315D1116